jgi:hypothetical protein
MSEAGIWYAIIAALVLFVACFGFARLVIDVFARRFPRVTASFSAPGGRRHQQK